MNFPTAETGEALAEGVSCGGEGGGEGGGVVTYEKGMGRRVEPRVKVKEYS